MTTGMLLLLAVGLSMDAFAVSVSNGMCCRMRLWKNALASGLAFGFFQGLMPLIGYLAGHTFSDVIVSVDHWIALLLLGFIGGRMVYESLKPRPGGEGRSPLRPFALRTLLLQAVATSIDALAVGVGLGVMQASLFAAVGLIALITFCLSFAGVVIGKRVGAAIGGRAELVGGLILLFIGARIFLEHTGYLAF